MILFCLFFIAVSVHAVGSFITSEKFGEQKFENVIVRNNIWGPGAGKQSLEALSGSSWKVTCNHGSSGGIKSYPHSGYTINKILKDVKDLKSTFSVGIEGKPVGVLSYSATYDIWLQKHKYEIMIWVKKEGKIGAIGLIAENNVNIGGFTFIVYKGTNGQNLVYSFLIKKNVDTGTIDLKAVLDWINTKKWFDEGDNVLIDEVQFGFEITSTPDNTILTVKNINCKVG